MVVKIAVLGAGVNGLACAVKITEKYKDARVSFTYFNYLPLAVSHCQTEREMDVQ